MRKEYQYNAAGAHCSNINHIAYIIVWIFQPAENPNEQAYILTFTLYSELFWKKLKELRRFCMIRFDQVKIIIAFRSHSGCRVWGFESS